MLCMNFTLGGLALSVMDLKFGARFKPDLISETLIPLVFFLILIFKLHLRSLHPDFSKIVL